MILMFVASAPVLAQISEGEPYSRTIKTGNRPVSGDYGIFIGPSLSEILQMVDDEISWRGLPLVNVKHYMSDNLEIRCGIQANKVASKDKGSVMVEDEPDVNVRNKDSEYLFRLTPGIARHFAPTNLLDVYVGATLPLGGSGEKIIAENSSFVSSSSERTSFEIGLGAYIGLQCFVADLPVAVGLEYGLSAVKYFGQKYKNVYTDEDGSEQTFYTKDFVGLDDTYYSKLSSSKGELGSDVRITISYFFK